MAFTDKMKEYIDKGIEVSKDALTKAGSAVQEFGDKSVTKIEIKQLESRATKECANLGLQVYDLMMEKGQKSIESSDAMISGYLNEILRLKDEIAKKNKLL